MGLENKMAILKLSGSNHSPLLVDFCDFNSHFSLYSPVARAVLPESPVMQKRACVAFLFNNNEPVKNAYPFHSSNKHTIPLKFFTRRQKAILWLQSFILN